MLRTLLFTLALAGCALLPQGVLLCVAASGHVEIEAEGTPCCPEESGDCRDCVDLESPDQLARSPSATLAAPSATPAADSVAPAALSAPAEEGSRRPPAGPLDERRTVVLLI